MNQECYRGVHAAAYLPLGIVAVIIFCIVPPVATAAIMWQRRKRREKDMHTKQMYGFLYRRYRCALYYWMGYGARWRENEQRS